MSDMLRSREEQSVHEETSSFSLARIMRDKAYFCARYAGACIPRAVMREDEIPPRFMHSFAPEWNVGQDRKLDHCGPHSVAALLHTAGKDMHPLDLVSKVPYKLHWGTHPVAMERLLKNEGFEPDPMQADHLPALQRIRFLEQELVRRPLILLMKDPELGLHYSLASDMTMRSGSFPCMILNSACGRCAAPTKICREIGS